MTTRNFDLKERNVTYQQLVGIESKTIHEVEKKYKVRINEKSDVLEVTGLEEDVEHTLQFLELASEVAVRYQHIDNQDLDYLFSLVDECKTHRFIEVMDELLTRTFNGKPVRAKTLGQKQLIDSMKSHDMTFAIGPAGTGKTYLAVCYAAEQLKKNEIQKIILTRPAVEAGENLGFLPGDLKEKVDPYLRPLYDALDDMFSPERTQRYIDKGVIEIAPLAYMRGRTLDDAVVILDEAQNTTKAQMMMFLSRLGRNSKMIITGDVDQIDLPRHQLSGLKVAHEYLQGINEIAFVKLTHTDVVRHPLVIKILKKFAEGDRNNEENSNHRR
ncbi:PhoH family protein [Erysipelothrix sp. HDW6C]|uniref:PhoH family protein n=1 Tax=Erysipelothrix sp. HDW6C TaxID=2714930 RepID=UPI00140B4FB2|nr:PhoH family protein [Erysipelothrix sp. HDW6C]QIK70177.1 PhoH family protein [Erysipelothrix sp. HDW6C]